MQQSYSNTYARKRCILYSACIVVSVRYSLKCLVLLYRY